MTGLLDRPAVGTWIKLNTPASVEIMAYAGFDFVVVDLEHTTLNLETAQTMIALATASGLTPLVRVPDQSPSTIQRILDGGAAGILVPHVDSAEQAEAVARACRFPPHGTRGSGATGTAGRWGQLPRADYLRHGNENVLCIPQLESEAAVRETGRIAAVAGVNAVFLGAADLAMDIGGGERVPELLARAREQARAAGIPCGSAGGSAQAARQAFDAGDAFVVCSNDTSMLAAAATSLVAAARDTSPAA
ncbi:hypothetical protein K7711_32060 [Nocardia sp. CA2R105]|uniref:HpcH/HpaI aldolase family protein n=1 Tax=Nocardia coffeae TaxID=2873381 RepID=UPI001CA6DA08|nr:aldolase/citrate lyase family protein [Nocardia coffeae]MBY8861149.1 hypothetical protein [Nocardia coffeae]